MFEKLINFYSLVWAIGYLGVVRPVKRWYRRHRRDADYFSHLGWLVGLVLSIILILWGLAQ